MFTKHYCILQKVLHVLHFKFQSHVWKFMCIPPKDFFKNIVLRMQDSQRSYICKYLCMFFCRQEGKHTVACLLLCFILEVNQQLKIHWFKLVRLNDWLICCFILDISKPLNFALFQNKSWFCIIGSFRLICFFRTSTFLFIC